MINIFKIKELKNDFIGSMILGFLLIVVIYFFNLNFVFRNILTNLGIISTISTTLAGFLITSLTIFLVFPENDKIKFIRLHPTYKYVFHAFVISIILFAILSVLSFCFKIFMTYVPTFLIALLIVLFIWSTTSLFRCLWLLKKNDRPLLLKMNCLLKLKKSRGKVEWRDVMCKIRNTIDAHLLKNSLC